MHLLLEFNKHLNLGFRAIFSDFKAGAQNFYLLAAQLWTIDEANWVDLVKVYDDLRRVRLQCVY